MIKKKKYIWLFGENNGKTANNNSYYMWEHIADIDDEIDKYFVMEKSTKNKQIYNSLTDGKKNRIIWRNSIKHRSLFRNADMFFVSLSYLDVQPTRFRNKYKDSGYTVNSPVIYLQHGTTAIKKLGYTGTSYWNSMFRFFIYNQKMLEILPKENDFKPYQLFYAQYHPRYKQTVKQYEEFKKNKPERKEILWFITWRENFGDNEDTTNFLNTIMEVINDKKLKKYLHDANVGLKLCMHSLFLKDDRKTFVNSLSGNDIKILDSSKIDVLNELVRCDLLITDYSSVGFDCTMLGKPVILFQPDREAYLQHREIYCTVEELKKYSMSSAKDLINTIISGKYTVNEFFSSRTPIPTDYEYIKNGKHIDLAYEYLRERQLNKITFLGYNFYGIGGTVSATKSLAEALLEKGYLVELLSLKRIKSDNYFPYGLNTRNFYISNRRNYKTIIKSMMCLNKKNFKSLNYDADRKHLIPYVGKALDKFLKNNNSNTVISTRESLHPFLKEATNPWLKNKIYFMHSFSKNLNVTYNGLLPTLKDLKMEKCAFVTEINRQQFISEHEFKHYDEFKVVGNAVTENMILPREEIRTIEKKEKYIGMYAVRVAKDRDEDLFNVINFGVYLKENNINNIQIDVFGKGDKVDWLIEEIKKKQLDKYIKYCGFTTIPHLEMRNHDCVADFSLNNSFGMPYIEGIVNGKNVFAFRNDGSNEVLKEIKGALVDNYEDLVKRFNDLPKVTQKELQDNYDKIMKRYSKDAVVNKFLELIDKYE